MAKLLSGKMTSKGQLTIPVELRKILHIEEGDRLEFELDDMGNVSSIRPKRKKTIADVVGRLKSDLEIDFDKAREAAHVERGYEILNKRDESSRGDNE